MWFGDYLRATNYSLDPGVQGWFKSSCMSGATLWGPGKLKWFNRFLRDRNYTFELLGRGQGGLVNWCARAHKCDVLHFLAQLPRTTSLTKSPRRRGNAKSVPMSTPAGVPDGEKLNTYQQIDPPRTRTWNLRLRRPTPYPLGQRALNVSIALHHDQQDMKSRDARHCVTTGPCMRALSDWSDAADNSKITLCEYRACGNLRDSDFCA